jgi:hypothetical protein
MTYQTEHHRIQRAQWAADFHYENHRWPTVREYEEWHLDNSVPFLTAPVPSGTPSIRPKHYLPTIIILLIGLVVYGCDVDLTFFDDGSGMVSWCEPFNPCMEYKP